MLEEMIIAAPVPKAEKNFTTSVRVYKDLQSLTVVSGGKAHHLGRFPTA
jgi:hypothetical protein